MDSTGSVWHPQALSCPVDISEGRNAIYAKICQGLLLRTSSIRSCGTAVLSRLRLLNHVESYWIDVYTRVCSSVSSMSISFTFIYAWLWMYTWTNNVCVGLCRYKMVHTHVCIWVCVSNRCRNSLPYSRHQSTAKHGLKTNTFQNWIKWIM